MSTEARPTTPVPHEVEPSADQQSREDELARRGGRRGGVGPGLAERDGGTGRCRRWVR